VQNCGKGNMLAIAPDSKEKCDEMYRKVIAMGATCDGEPIQRIMALFRGNVFVI
jgi:hypothetical protein